MCEKAENLLEKKTGNEYYIVYIRFFVGRRELEEWHYQVFLHQK
nr:MAG TPA: hypothetical protein [Caudoviricetes sp.]